MYNNDLKIYKKIGQRIRKVRQSKGLSQLDLALSLGKTQAYISKIEKGERRIPLELLIELSKVLEVPVEELAPELFIKDYSSENLLPEELIEKIFKSLKPQIKIKVIKNLIDLVNS